MTGVQWIGMLLLGVWLACPRQRSSGRHDRRYKTRLSEGATNQSGLTPHAGSRPAEQAPSESRVYQLVRHQPSPGCPGSRDGAGAPFYDREQA